MWTCGGQRSRTTATDQAAIRALGEVSLGTSPRQHGSAASRSGVRRPLVQMGARWRAVTMVLLGTIMVSCRSLGVWLKHCSCRARRVRQGGRSARHDHHDGVANFLFALQVNRSWQHQHPLFQQHLRQTKPPHHQQCPLHLCPLVLQGPARHLPVLHQTRQHRPHHNATGRAAMATQTPSRMSAQHRHVMHVCCWCGRGSLGRTGRHTRWMVDHAMPRLVWQVSQARKAM